MTTPDISALLSGEDLFAKNTTDHDRPSRDEIASLAYHLFEKRNRQDGADLDDWLSAEEQLRHHHR